MIHNKQFIITNTDIILDGFIKIDINTFFVYINTRSVYEIVKDENDKTWILIGLAFCADGKDKSPGSDIKNSKSKEVDVHLMNWAGRWCLIGEDSIQTDCVGLLSLYYYQQSKNFYISPSLSLIKKYYLDADNYEKETLIGNHSFDWYPLPLTKYKNVYHLIPSQKIIIENGRMKIVFKKNIVPVENMSDEKIGDQIGQYLENTLYNIGKFSKKNIHLALTGGADSRTLLSILLNKNIQFKSYTMNYSMITKTDKKLPFILSKKYGFMHKLINGKTTNKQKLKDFDYHTNFNLNDGNRLFFAKSQFDLFTDEDILIKGAVFELGKGFYHSTLLSSNFTEKDLYEAFPDIKFIDGYQESLSNWFDWAKKYPLNIDLRDRLYLEQRNCGWIGALEQGLDILESFSIHPANSGIVVSLLLSLSTKSKLDGNINTRIINSYTDSLLDYPINQKDKLRMFKYYMMKIKKHPISTIKKGLRYLKIKTIQKENKNDIKRKITK